MSTQRILICSCETILGAAVEELLAGEFGLEVIGIPNMNTTQIIEALKMFNPDTIIIADQLCANSFEQIQEAVHDFSNKSLISLSADNSWVQIIQERKLWVPQSKDLLQVIRSLWKEG